MNQLRDTISFRNITVSVQASADHYCSPREDGLPLDAYELVEVGVIGPKLQEDDGRGLVMPSSLGVGGFDHFFEEGGSPVAGYFPTALLSCLLAQLEAAS